MESSGGSEERDAVGVDFWGDPDLLKDRVARSTRPEVLDVVEEWFEVD